MVSKLKQGSEDVFWRFPDQHEHSDLEVGSFFISGTYAGISYLDKQKHGIRK